MSWWHSLQFLRKYELLPHSKLNEIISQCPPPQKSIWHSSAKDDPSLISSPVLIMKLLSKYPEMSYVPGPKISLTPEELPVNSSIILSFVNKQKELMKKGFTEQKAFEMVEEKYQDRMQRKKADFILTRDAAINNQARSLMNFYQQQAEYEGRLKVLRMERDLLKYEDAKRTFEENIMEKSEGNAAGERSENFNADLNEDLAGANSENLSDEKILEEIKSEKNEKNANFSYRKVLEKIVVKASGSSAVDPDDLEKKSVEEEKKDAQETVKSFLEGTRNVFALYLELAGMKDKLSGLKDQEISQMLRDSPKKFKARTKILRRKLEKFGIFLTEFGELDFSKSSAPESIKKKLKENPLAKMALMAKELDFEFEHLEKKQELARNLKERLEDLEKPQLSLAAKAEEDKIKNEGTLLEGRSFESYEPLEEKVKENEGLKDTTKKMMEDLDDQAVFFKKEASYR